MAAAGAASASPALTARRGPSLGPPRRLARGVHCCTSVDSGAKPIALVDDPWCVLAASSLAGGVAPLAPWPTALGFLVSWLGLAGRWGPGLCLLAPLAFLVGGVRAELAAGEFEGRRRGAIEYVQGPRRCSAEVRVARSPVVRDGSLAWIGDARRIDCEGQRHPGPLRLRLYGGPHDLGRGDVVEVVAQLAPVRLFRNAELADPLPGARRSGALLSGSVLSLAVVERGGGLTAHIDAARAHTRGRIEATFPELARPMARALVLGENDLDPEDDAAFKRSGLMHLLAVSGTHLVFAVVMVVQGLRACLIRVERAAGRWDVTRVSAGFGVLASLLYADFSGGSGSAWRAAWMLSAVFLARVVGARLGGCRALGISLAVGVLDDPLAAVDISFALSAAATWGLLVLGQPLGRRCGGIRSAPLRYVAVGTIATVTSTIPCAPLLAMMDERLTFAGLVANLLAAPLGELAALPSCLLHAAVSGLPWLEQGLALVGAGALLGVRWVALRSAEASFASFVVPLPGPWHVAVLVAASALAAAAPPRGRRWVLLAGLGALCVLEGRARVPPQGALRVTLADVGQGDAALLELPEGALALIDGGGFAHGFPDPGERVLLPLLRARRRETIALVILSHAHADHLQGLLAVLRRHRVEALWHPAGAGAEVGQYAELLRLARAQGTRLLGPDELCGGPARILSGARFEILGPCPVQPGVGLNDNSLVVRVSFGRRSILFTGDAEREQEARLLASGVDLRADVLKAGHHGSDSSSSLALLRAVAPRWATISCGVRNRFDHPREVTLARFAELGIAALRTDRSGSLQFVTDGRDARWHVAALPW